MNKLVRDYIEVGQIASLDHLIERLTAIRDGLPDGADAQVRLRGDDHFGRHIAIAYKRPLRAEEAECERRYADSDRDDGGLRAAA